MHYLSGPDVAAVIHNLIERETQQHDYETDLTAAAVYALSGPGAVDFGGAHYEMAPREEMPLHKARESDALGWWQLEAGSYVLRFNETAQLGEAQIAFIQPHERLMLAGASHPTFYFRGRRQELKTLLNVGGPGVRIHQNARVSKLLILQL